LKDSLQLLAGEPAPEPSTRVLLRTRDERALQALIERPASLVPVSTRRLLHSVTGYLSPVSPRLTDMSRRSTPERIFAAHRIAVRNGLTDNGMPLETAEAWCDAWEAEAELRGIAVGSADYWSLAGDWIAKQRRTRKLPM
jgi:hypothetical protein